MPYRKILLATDFSRAADNALEHAAVLADRSGAEVHALHINIVSTGHATEADMPGTGAYLMALAKASEDYLEKLPVQREIPVRNVVRNDYSPAHGILAYAEEAGVDLIVLGTHGRTGLKHVLLGSVAAQVVRAAPVPVLVVGPDDGHEVNARGIRCIVAATDLSEHSAAGVRHAAELAAKHGAGLHVVHIMVPPLVHPYDLDILTTMTDVDAGEKALAEFVGSLGLEVKPQCHVTLGYAHTEVNAIAELVDADLLVISAHGRSAAMRLLLGSVADKIVRTAPCPVLVWRPRDSQ